MKNVTYTGTKGEDHNVLWVTGPDGNQVRLPLDQPQVVSDEVAQAAQAVADGDGGHTVEVTDSKVGQGTKDELLSRASELDVDVPSGATKDQVAQLVAQAEADAASQS